MSPILVRKGENVGFCVYAMHRRKDLYGDDATDFRPERWEEDLPLFRDEKTAAWGYLPFNGGPRVCLGRELPSLVEVFLALLITSYAEEFALMEASYTVVRILQKYPRVKSVPSERPQIRKWTGRSSHQNDGVEMMAEERQKMTLVLSLGDGCRVIFGR